MGLLLDKVTVRKFEDAVVEVVSWGLAAGAFVRNSETDVTLLEEAWDEDMTPLLLKEGVLLHLFAALSALLLGLAHFKRSTKTAETATIGI